MRHRRITTTRLRNAERRAPKPFQRWTIATIAVDPNPAGSCEGPPVYAGVAKVLRTRRGAPPIIKLLDPPRADLIDAEWDAMTDEEIAALGIADA